MYEMLTTRAVDELTLLIVKRLLEQEVKHATIAVVIDDIQKWEADTEAKAIENAQEAAKLGNIVHRFTSNAQ